MVGLSKPKNKSKYAHTVCVFKTLSHQILYYCSVHHGACTQTHAIPQTYTSTLHVSPLATPNILHLGVRNKCIIGKLYYVLQLYSSLNVEEIFVYWNDLHT